MKAMLKILLYISLSALSLFSLAVVAFFIGMRWEAHLPSEQTARQQFVGHRIDYVRFASLLQQDPGVRFIGADGMVGAYTSQARIVPEYRDLMRKIGAKGVLVRDDGSIEFTLWGFGCAICSDSFMGIRYLSVNHRPQERSGWVPNLVSSLDSRNLPHANGSVEDGLYIVRLEPEWFIYRLEYHE